MQRPRGLGGRFLTKEKVAEMETLKGNGREEGGDLDATLAKMTSEAGAGLGIQQKAEGHTLLLVNW